MKTADRAKRAFEALDGYAAEHGQTHTQIREFLRDLRHYCREEGISFADVNLLAQMDFLEHVEGRDFDIMPKEVK